MKKADAERAIRTFCHEWRKETGRAEWPKEQLVFSSFVAWLEETGKEHVLNFQSPAGPRFLAELWFDQEFQLTSHR